MPLFERWRQLPFEPRPSAENFARSESLTRLADRPTVWWHTSPQTALIVGSGQKLPAEVERYCLDSAIRLVKRQAGGTLVLANREVVGLDIALPRDHPLAHADVTESYRWLGEIWLAAIERLGVAGHLVSIPEARSQPQPPADIASVLRAACFGSLSPYELTVEGRKLVGLAQVRRRAAVLWQAAIHLHFDAGMLASVLAPTRVPEIAAALRARVTGLDELTTTKPTVESVMAVWNREVEDRYGVSLEAGHWTEEEIALASDFDGSILPAG